MYLKNVPKEQLEQIVKESFCYNDVIRKLGYTTTSGRNHWTIKRRIDELGIDISHFSYQPGKKRSNEELFVENSDANPCVVRKRYKKCGFTEYKCVICGQGDIWNGKPITLVLDHENGDNTDNRLENLRWVCPNCNSQLPTTGYKGIKKYDEYGKKIDNPVKIQKKQKKNFCSECGKEIGRHSIKCVKCANTIPLDKMRISRDELKSKIRTSSFTAIGKEFGVKDNCIRKWCKKYDLPYRSMDIKQYTDEEWIAV